MRASVRREREIDVSADVAWAVVSDAAGLHRWFPGIETCAVDGDTRVITLGSGISLSETLLTNDPLQRRFQYRITAPMFREHLSTLDVLDLGDGTSVVVYAADAVPSTMALVIAGAAGNALENLRDLMESQPTEGES